MLTPDRVAAGRIALDLPLLRFDGTTTSLREHLADPLVVLIWSSW